MNTQLRIDVGMAGHYGGSPAVLELQNGNARVIVGDVGAGF